MDVIDSIPSLCPPNPPQRTAATNSPSAAPASTRAHDTSNRGRRLSSCGVSQGHASPPRRPNRDTVESAANPKAVGPLPCGPASNVRNSTINQRCPPVPASTAVLVRHPSTSLPRVKLLSPVSGSTRRVGPRRLPSTTVSPHPPGKRSSQLGELVFLPNVAAANTSFDDAPPPPSLERHPTLHPHRRQKNVHTVT